MLRHAHMKLLGILSIALPTLAGALLLSAPASADDAQIITQSQISRPLIAQPNAAVSGTSSAARYRPDAFLTLDLSKAVLSPIPLGPQARFEPFGIEARTDAADNLPNTTPHAARTASKIMAGARIAPRPGVAASSDVKPSEIKPADTASLAPPTDATADESAATSATKSRTAKGSKPSAIRTRAAASRRHGNPLDAQAYARPKTQARAQPKVQTWPCRSGGICGWQN